MVSFTTTKNISQLSISETVIGGTVCGKTARTDLWGSGAVTIRSTRTLGFRNESEKANKIGCSTVILPRNRSHHYGEKKNRRTYLILQAFWLVIENLINNPGLIVR